MKKRWLVLSVLLGVMLCVTPTFSADTFDKPEFAARRSRLMAQIGDGAAVVFGATTRADDNDFRQGHDFFYLTGLELPDAVLVVDGLRKESVLFFTIDEATADGYAIPLDLVRKPVEYSGIERAQPAEQFSAQLTGFINRNRVIYTMFKPEELGRENSNEKFNALQKSMTQNPWDARLTRELQFVKHLRERYPQADVRDSSPIVWNLRKYKSTVELAIMRETARIGVEGHKALIASTRVGVAEKALAAVFDFVTKKAGAQDLAYSTIIMSGKNHAYGHYHEHDRVLNDGDFLILDAAPDYQNYHVDISTTFPASGRFSARQKELYEAALAVHDVAMESYRPGTTFKEVGLKVDAMLKAKGLDRFSQDFRGIVRLGGYNHSIGLATHDVMGSFAGADEVLKPGFVFACDIQLFRLDEQIGIRIEDTVAITERGYENLSAGLPRTVAEIEALMKTDGLLQILKKAGR
ncbi:MAG: aminopeptidase P family protein [Acidobacteria bacterium]|nr:aminopeptidase P family protein [Acidobacteriota bacterium]